MRAVWDQACLVRSPASLGGRPHRRKLEKQPAGEPSTAVPKLPLHHRYIQGPPKGTPDPDAPAPEGGGTPMKGARYTKDVLTAAAENCSTMEEVVVFLGTAPYGKLHRYLRGRFAHFGIDISHFAGPTRGRGYSRPRPSASELRNAVASSRSLAETLRHLGRPDNSLTRRKLKDWLAQDGVSTSHFLGQAHQRGRDSLHKKTAEEVLVKHESGRRTTSALLRRALRDVGVPDRCANCGTGPSWLGRPMTLEIDHVNGDREDNRLGNLRLLCPNCHAITSTWCRGGRPEPRTQMPARSVTAPATMVDARGRC